METAKLNNMAYLLGNSEASLILIDPGSDRRVIFEVVKKIPNKCVERRNSDFNW